VATLREEQLIVIDVTALRGNSPQRVSQLT